MKKFIVKQIINHLVGCGLNESSAAIYAEQGYDHFKRKICNSKDVFKDACDYAGSIAEVRVNGFKYKPPKKPRTQRTKRPQEAFDFGKQ